MLMKYKYLPIVLVGVNDTAYPPVDKNYAMLRHMCQHHLHDYHWFMRADDDVYIKINHLTEFLGKLDSKQMVDV